MALALDRRFVHRLRVVTGKDGNPLNELELVAASLIDHGGALHLNNVVKYEPDESVLNLARGDRIALSAAEFERLSGAFLSDVRAKFVPPEHPAAGGV